ncbi:MAG: 3-deoxy-D-manno-octulosonic acid transferase [bacterium]
MIWIIYNLAFPFVLLLMLPYYLIRMCRRGGYRKGFAQRLGVYEGALWARLRERPRVWVHAVSVGETFVAVKFMEAWRRQEPDIAFVMSVNTSTAHAMAEKMLHPDDVLVYFPVDFPWVIRRALRAFQPRMLVLTECEFWPNLMRMAKRRGVPLLLMNGRLSDRSFRGYRRFRWLFAPVMRLLDGLCVQGRQDAERYLALGAGATRVTVTGSAKYDVALGDPGQLEKAREWLDAAGISEGDPVLLGGSTWAGEEEVLLDILTQCRPACPSLRLVLVPRHAERRDEVVAAIRRRGLTFVQRSLGGRAAPGERPDVLLVDTTGELKHFYRGATVIFVGKSLTQHGGQNIIEPAVCGKPIVVGPNMENFPDVIRDFTQAQALIQVADAAQLGRRIGDLLGDEAARRAYGERAAGLVENNRGALSLTVARAIILAAPAR